MRRQQKKASANTYIAFMVLLVKNWPQYTWVLYLASSPNIRKVQKNTIFKKILIRWFNWMDWHEKLTHPLNMFNPVIL
jgi:hypothetical protein